MSAQVTAMKIFSSDALSQFAAEGKGSIWALLMLVGIQTWVHQKSFKNLALHAHGCAPEAERALGRDRQSQIQEEIKKKLLRFSCVIRLSFSRHGQHARYYSPLRKGSHVDWKHCQPSPGFGIYHSMLWLACTHPVKLLSQRGDPFTA